MNKRSEIIVLDGYAANPGDLSWDGLNDLGVVGIYERSATENEVITRSKNAFALITNKAPISAYVIENCPHLKYIGVCATGYNVVDISAANKHGITVTNVPSYSTEEVVQMVFAFLFEITIGVGLHNDAVKNGCWTRSKDFSFWKKPLISLYGKTIGIIGYGRIGRSVANSALSFGMNVLVNTRTPSNVNNLHVKSVSLDELFAYSDIITLHCPLTENNREMINAAAIQKMKHGVIIINTARGPLINENDLASALKSGKVYWAGCDVVSKEPILPDNPLLSCDNCFITPHIAWASKEARQRLIGIVIENLKAFVEGRPQNVIN